MKNALVTTLALILAACGGPLLGGEVEEQNICIRKAATTIQGLCNRPEFAAVQTLPLIGQPACQMDLAILLANANVLPASVTDAINSVRDADTSGSLPLGDKIPALGEKGTTGSLKVLSLTVSGTSQALSLLDSVSAEFTKVGEATPVLALDYARDAESYSCDAITQVCTMTVKVKAGVDNDIFKHLNGGDIAYHITVKGKPGTEALQSLWQDWTASVETCMSAKLTVDALELLKNK